METLPLRMVITDFAQADFAAVLGVKLRRGDLTREGAAIILYAFDGWLGARRYRAGHIGRHRTGGGLAPAARHRDHGRVSNNPFQASQGPAETPILPG